ncbi:biogenesis of lysosome-related organelles complex-1 subunit 2 [Maniola hyperantus]|uniref:biogenesis of lysosome-related organelles complex-1 subunit 2 n=1 Tax=Aphantopus hyperantus TaxID=2795564 RepID=UPI0015693514|nr:biogenesis of lysosome-related organelles complex-1 subunit 2 [Maniola hyperantus]
MSKEDVDKRARETQNRDEDLSRSCSCFEMLDPHDPVISRLATQLFKKTDDYWRGEVMAGQDYYTLLEQINRLATTKHADVRSLAINLSKTLNEYNEIYSVLIKPLLLQIDQIDAKVELLEANAYRLDSYTKRLKARFKELQEN